MSTDSLVFAVLLLSFLAANLPFASERFLGLFVFKHVKTLGMRLLELLLLYFLVGVAALMLERHVGQVAAQGWEFYAVTVSLFLTFAFPGFVCCYLFRCKDS